jgi:hypothetical protein
MWARVLVLNDPAAWIHFRSMFLAAVVALQIILSFSVTYFVYRVLLGIPKAGGSFSFENKP